MRRAIQVFLLATASAGLATADITFSLDPAGGAVSGYAGQTVGWGFTVANALSDYAVITSAVFVTDPADFTDFISPQYVIVGPGTPVVTQAFDLALQQGVGSYLIPASPVGSLFAGSIELTYDLYTVNPNDPLFNPVTDLEASGETVAADASIDVVATPVPEPVNVILWATMLAIVTFGYSRKPRRLAHSRETTRP